MSGPWYEEQGPTTKEVKSYILSELQSSKEKYKLIHPTMIKKVVENIVAKYLQVDHVTMKYGWGSYRGYYTFAHNNLMKVVNKELQIKKEDIARKKINAFIMKSPWVQNILYRPPTKTQKAGRLYVVTKLHFTHFCNESKPTLLTPEA